MFFLWSAAVQVVCDSVECRNTQRVRTSSCIYVLVYFQIWIYKSAADVNVSAGLQRDGFFFWFITSLAVARDILKLSGSPTARKQILSVSTALRDNLSSVPPHLTEIKNHKSNFKELRTCISRKFLSTYKFSASTSSSMSCRVRLSPCTSPDKSHYDEVCSNTWK